jgi:hypothetical protein
MFPNLLDKMADAAHRNNVNMISWQLEYHAMGHFSVFKKNG